MEAGSAHGISAGAEFAVYADQHAVLTSEPLGHLMVQRIEFFHTILKPTSGRRFSMGQSAVAMQTKLGEKEDLSLHVEFDEKFKSVFEALLIDMQKPGPDSAKIALVERGQAKMEIVMEEDQLYFNMLDERITAYGVSRIPHPVETDPEEIRRVLRAAAHYFWHLDRNSGLDKQFASNVNVKFLQLQVQDDFDEDVDEPIWNPVPNTANLYTGGAVDLVVDINATYGIQLTNNTPWDLYPAVFLFKDDLGIGQRHAATVIKG